MRLFTSVLLFTALLLLLSGCNMNEAPSGPLEEWALTRAAGAVNAFSEAFGGEIIQALDDLKNAEYEGGPFENNLDSARAYLLEQMREKYGMEFTVVGRENLQNYGPFAGASYSCQVAPANAPEQVTMALVSQTRYQDVRDGYAVYFFREEAEAPVLALCRTKDYVLDQRISLEMPETEKVWSAEDGLERFLAESGAYVKAVLRFPDGLEADAYAEYLQDFLNSLDGLECNLLLQAKADKKYLFHRELDLLDGFDASQYTLEDLKQVVEEGMSLPLPE